MNTIKIGTRASKLALVQAEYIRDELQKIFPDKKFELVKIKTKGDKILDAPLSKIGDKGLFTKELETELLDGAIDLAVHSMKDMPTALPEGLKINTTTKRLDPRDVLISKNNKKFADIKSGDTIATSSLRRKSQLLALKPGINIVDIRGNVLTRLDKLKNNPEMDGMILAYAGIARLDLKEHISDIIPAESIIPAVGQASLAIETRENDEAINSIVSSLNDENSMMEIACERKFLSVLEGGCQVPIAAYAKIENNVLTMNGLVASLDGNEIIKDIIEGPASDHDKLGEELAQKLLKAGAKRILDEIYNK